MLISEGYELTAQMAQVPPACFMPQFPASDSLSKMNTYFFRIFVISSTRFTPKTHSENYSLVKLSRMNLVLKLLRSGTRPVAIEY